MPPGSPDFYDVLGGAVVFLILFIWFLVMLDGKR